MKSRIILNNSSFNGIKVLTFNLLINNLIKLA